MKEEQTISQRKTWKEYFTEQYDEKAKKWIETYKTWEKYFIDQRNTKAKEV